MNRREWKKTEPIDIDVDWVLEIQNALRRCAFWGSIFAAALLVSWGAWHLVR